LYDLYKINYSWPLNGTPAGYWAPKQGISFNLTQYKYSRRKDLRGIVYKAAIVVSIIYPPYSSTKHEVINIYLFMLNSDLYRPQPTKHQVLAVQVLKVTYILIYLIE
jgi:hypothetical protein